MKSPIRFKMLLLFVLATTETNAQFVQSNVTQYVALETWGTQVKSSIKSQTVKMGEIAAVNSIMNAQMNQVSKWEKEYSNFLQKVDGYASALKAATTLYYEGTNIVRNIYLIIKMASDHPEGIVASIPMTNIYTETAIECVKVYRTLKINVAKGQEKNQLTTAERTELLWMLDDKMQQLNDKLRQLAISIAYYNMVDVWNKATAGIIDKDASKIAREALERWRRASVAAIKINSVKYPL